MPAKPPKAIDDPETLNSDLAAKHRAYRPGPERTSPAVEADFAVLQRDGYVIIEGLLDHDDVASIRAAVTPLLDRFGRNTFEGTKTQRVYNVLAKTEAIDRLADHPRVLGLMDRLFLPNFLLSQAQVINLCPGETPQMLHPDDGFYRIPRPRAPLGAATIWAIDDFTADNGATLVVPESHEWGDDRRPSPAETIKATMPAGSVLVFVGTTWHGGGQNTTESPRLAVTCQYCEPYLRQQESFLLELSRDRVRAMSPALQSMVGYSIMPPFMGMVDGKHPLRLLEQR